MVGSSSIIVTTASLFVGMLVAVVRLKANSREIVSAKIRTVSGVFGAWSICGPC